MFETTTEIDAPQEAVWLTLVDIERWPTWTQSMRELAWIGDAGMKTGNRARVKQPKMPTLVWEVCELQPGSSFSWRSTSLGVTTLATHTLETIGNSRTAVTLGIEQSGPLARLVGALTGRRTARYVQMECDGLRSKCESRPVL